MSFSSLIFVTLFLPAFFLLYCLMPDIRWKNRLWLAASLIFYGAGGIRYLLLLLLAAAVSYAGACRIYDILRTSGPEDGRKRGKKLLWLTVSALLLLLVFFKYTAFILNSAVQISGVQLPVPSIALPMGISFYIFKLISYITDVYRGETVPGSYGELLLYTVMFQEAMQGPITRFDGIRQQLRERVFHSVDFSDGMYRFVLGLGKKTLLADHLGELAESLAPLAYTSGSVAGAYAGGLCYMLELYLDFSAYSDMAIGLLKMLGVTVPENFRYPYAASSVREFWRRWHISLSLFFRDYVYIPLGGSRVGRGRLLLNVLVVWLLTGFWHGASWNFAGWGLYYFFWIMLENLLRKPLEKVNAFLHSEKSGGLLRGLWRAAGHVYTLAVVYWGWILFRFTDAGSLKQVLNTMLLRNGAELIRTVDILTIRNNLFFLAVAVFACTPVLCRMDADRQLRLEHMITRQRRQKGENLFYIRRTAIFLVLLVLSVFAMAGSSYSPFLYNQF